MEKLVLFLLLIFDVCCGIIYELNDTMYYRMPPVFHLDDYGSCTSDQNGVYCFTKVELVSDTPSELLDMILNYSDHKVKHYNHSKLRLGVCVTESCKEHYNDMDKEGDLKTTLERCLNETFWTNYKLKTKTNSLFCNRKEDEISIGYAEYAVAAVCIALVFINVIGSCYDVFYAERNMGKGNSFLLAFSLKRNWLKLTAPVDVSDPYLERFKGFYGIRSIAMVMVITVHSVLPFINAAQNPRYVEAIYDNILYHTLLNGTPVVQVFFIMSGFLLAFNTQRVPEKERPTLLSVPKIIFLRWLRLIPVYAVVLAITCTWLRVAGSGPLWHEAVILEADHCRHDAWQNLLFINNYFDYRLCMPQTWYLAADMQLYCLGIFLCVILTTNTSRKLVLSVLFIAGVVIPGVVTYLMDLDGVLIISPDTALNFFVLDPTFNNTYKRGHTNLSSFIIGISMGYLTHHLMSINFNIEKYKKYKWMYQLLVPSFITMTWIGSIFYQDAPQHPVYFRALYIAITKPTFALILALYILGMIFKCDEKHRRILEWRHWISTGRLSYCAYSVHILVIRTYLGLRQTLMSSVFIYLVFNAIGTVIVSFGLAIPLWLLVESPFNQLVRLAFFGASSPKRKKIQQKKPKKSKTSK